MVTDRLISLIFSQLDPLQQGRQFSVVLDVSESGKWEGMYLMLLYKDTSEYFLSGTVVNLDPHIHGVEALKQKLNSNDGGITAFCKAFREQCKKHITQCHDN